jgi:hypothetical protein
MRVYLLGTFINAVTAALMTLTSRLSTLRGERSTPAEHHRG